MERTTDTKYRLLEVMRRVKRIGHAAHMSPQGTPPAEARIMLTVHDMARISEDPVQPRTLAERIHMTPSAVSQILKALEEKGLIERHRNADDNRVVTIVLTEEGERLAAEVEAMHDAHLGDLIDAIGEDDANELIRIVGKIIDHYSDSAAPCCPGMPREKDEDANTALS